MKRVYKYIMKIDEFNPTKADTNIFRMNMPVDASPIEYGFRMIEYHDHVGGELIVWATVNVDDDGSTYPVEEIPFRVYGTGHNIHDAHWLKHVRTCFDGPFVWHIFRGCGI